MVATIVTSMLVESPRHVPELQQLLQSLKTHEQRKFLLSTVAFVTKRYMTSLSFASKDAKAVTASKAVAGAAALLSVIVKANQESMVEHLSAWLLQASNAPILTYRAVLTVLPDDEANKVLEQLWTKFSDQLFIKHAPVVQQESQ